MIKLKIQIELREDLSQGELEKALWGLIETNPRKIASAKLVNSKKFVKSTNEVKEK